MGFLAAILNWNFGLQNLNFTFHKSEVPTEILYFYIDIQMFVKWGHIQWAQ